MFNFSAVPVVSANYLETVLLMSKKGHFSQKNFHSFLRNVEINHTRCTPIHETHDTFFCVLFYRILRCGRHRPIRLPGPPGRPWWALASRPWGRATDRAALEGPQCGCPWWGRAESPLMDIQVRWVLYFHQIFILEMLPKMLNFYIKNKTIFRCSQNPSISNNTYFPFSKTKIRPFKKISRTVVNYE